MNSEISKTIHVVIADDHLIVREGLRLILETGPGIELVGDAANGMEACRLVEQLQPDVVLMDLRMPGMDGLEAIEHIHAQWPQVAIVILTTYNEDDLMLRGLRAGACGYLLKDTSRETLLDAIRTAARGETLLQQATMTLILAHTPIPHHTHPPHHTHRNINADNPKLHIELTEREQKVLNAVARGERSKEIAVRLGITERTVKAHLSSIYTKLGVDSRASAVAIAYEHGLL